MACAIPDPLAHYVRRWTLTPEGEPVVTATSYLLPVRAGRSPAMLKVARIAEERRANSALAWWSGHGAAPVLAQEGDAVLMARARGGSALAQLVRTGRDEEATLILCRVAARLHARRAPFPAELIELREWFSDLAAARTRGGIFAPAWEIAAALFEDPRETVALHGDLHHGNVLDFGRRGWLAIDPKALRGERTFDFVNILRNPDFRTATAPGRFARHAALIAAEAGLDVGRLLRWTFAFCALSAVWHAQEGNAADLDVAIAELAAASI